MRTSKSEETPSCFTIDVNKGRRRTPGRPVGFFSRTAGIVLASMIAAAALVAAPSNTPAAHAQEGSASMDTTVELGYSDFVMIRNPSDNGGSASFKFGHNAEKSKPDAQFKIVPLGNGSFEFKNIDSGQCLKSHIRKGEGQAVSEWDCDGSETQKWYVQPSRLGFLVRSVALDECLTQDPQRNVLITAPCLAGDGNQWMKFSSLNGSDLTPRLTDMAGQYGLSQFNAKHPAIKSATYKVDSHSKAKPGPLRMATLASGIAFNRTTELADSAIDWAQETSDTVSVGLETSVEFSNTVGGGILPAATELTIGISLSFGYEHSWSTSHGGEFMIHLKPDTHGWVLRGQLSKDVTGHWTITNDLGTTWTVYGTANVPVPEGTDGMHSILWGCSSDSLDQSCLDTDIIRP